MRAKKKIHCDTRNWNRYQFFGIAYVSVRGKDRVYSTTIANVSLSGLGVYSAEPVGKGGKVTVTISFVDGNGKMRQDSASGKIDWQRKFLDLYLVGILFDEELNILNQPRLVGHLSWLIDTYQLPQPYRDKRIALL